MDLKQLWQIVLGEVEINISRANFTTWFKNTFIESMDDGRLIIGVPNGFTKVWLEGKYHNEIISTLKKILKLDNLIIEYKICSRPAEIKAEEYINPKPESSDKAPLSEPSFSKPLPTNRFGLNPRYTFANFIVGKNNELAYAASQAVANNPGYAYNPLVLYGDVGLGKTHLLQAIGNELCKKTEKVLYATSEKFSNDYINEVRAGRGKFLKEKYRGVDVLLIDDIQFIGGKDGTQEEFFHTFNELHQANKQIIATSDRPLKAIPLLEKRLLSRLEWGMVTDITMPDMETRIAILKNKCTEKNYPLPEAILIYIAERVKNNIRELEGCLIKLITHYEFNNLTPSIESVKRILFNVLTEYQAISVSPERIIGTALKFYNIDSQDLLGKSRKKELVAPRQITMYILRELLGMSFPNIGQQLGGRDHTTVMHAWNKIKAELEENERLKQEINSLIQNIKTT